MIFLKLFWPAFSARGFSIRILLLGYMELDHPNNVCKFYKNYKKLAGISKLSWWMRGNITIQLWKLAKKITVKSVSALIIVIVRMFLPNLVVGLA